MRVGVVLFPGSNCDHDVEHVLREVCGAETVWLWHKDPDLCGAEAVVLPGGFTYGDYLRVGAIAKESPVMKEVARFAQRGGPVLGICNGFQILCEARLLPGALLRNRSLRFLCKHIHLRFEGHSTPFTRTLREGQVLEVPIAHGMGNYFADEETLRRIEGDGRVVFRYCDERGEITAAANPNGSCRSIAGIASERGNVVGMMPHPERCSERALGGEDGRALFESLLQGGGR